MFCLVSCYPLIMQKSVFAMFARAVHREFLKPQYLGLDSCHNVVIEKYEMHFI